ncbi:MAG: hypothetical protein P8Q95_07995 [Candidatus Poseidoniaceae archaeon]|jgi:hypothetical protein|nr:hypothetical protein [Candidatus Poseidoniaceae archaeon]|tara:strand:- start:574 stop:801 length:228 start_codon:yes stop_codon:yes gene_type:complete
MPNEWILKLDIKSRDLNCTESLAAALTTDCEINWNGDSFHIMINEAKAKDLRAMWNTRVRGLIAVDSLLDVIDGY